VGKGEVKADDKGKIEHAAQGRQRIPRRVSEELSVLLMMKTHVEMMIDGAAEK
jgi:hypothetical protein